MKKTINTGKYTEHGGVPKTHMINNQFPNQMKALRKVNGITQQTLAKALGIGQTTVANYENGVRLPDLDMLIRIANYFGISVDTLVGRGESKLSGNNFTYSYEDYMDALLSMDKNRIHLVVQSLLNEGISMYSFYHDYVTRALHRTGDLWAKGDLAVWKEHFISELAMEHMAMLKGKLDIVSYKHSPILALVPGAGTHTIALKMMTNLLEADGYFVIYLGNHVPADNLFSVIKEHGIEHILMSVTMTYHIDAASMLIEKIKSKFLTKAPKILIGGNAFEQIKDPLKQTGADAYCMKYEDILKNIK